MQTTDPLLAVLIGAGLTLGTVILTEIWKHYSGRRDKIKKGIMVLELTRSEVMHYIGILGTLTEQLSSLCVGIERLLGQRSSRGEIHALKNFPSYSIYPELLGSLRVQVSETVEDHVLASKVSKAHYELAHVEERLNDLKIRGQRELSYPELSNFEGTNKLVQQTIKLLNELEGRLKEKINSLNRTLCEPNTFE